MSVRLASDDPEAERRALAAGELWRSAQRFLDERERALRESRTDFAMLLEHTWMALRLNGGLTAMQYTILMRELHGDEVDVERDVSVVRPLMRVEIPHLVREDI